jgi:6-phosphogluconolactonase
VRLIVEDDADSAARTAASEIANACEAALEERNRTLIALSGGRTPVRMIEHLREHLLRWSDVYVVQVDERVVPDGDPRRNLSPLEALLVREGPLPRDNLLEMPVGATDLAAAARDYDLRLASLGGAAPRFDLVQLGLGTDGHVASLFPDDPALESTDRDVAVTDVHEGTRRMTLTLRVLSRARQRLWLVIGAAKARRLAELIEGRAAIPANRVERLATIVVADREAAASAARVSPS